MMNWKGFERKQSWPNFKVLCRPSPGGTEEKDEKAESGKPFSGPRFEPGTSQIRSRSVDHDFSVIILWNLLHSFIGK
jgi:hypothetical protein